MQGLFSVQWTAIEEMKYHFFLVFRLDRFQKKAKKLVNIFKQMSAFVGTRSPKQCRSHHQKRTKTTNIIVILQQFYRDFYEIRLLSLDHCQKQIRHYFGHNLEQISDFGNQDKALQNAIKQYMKHWNLVLSKQRPTNDQNTQTNEEPKEGINSI